MLPNPSSRVGSGSDPGFPWLQAGERQGSRTAWGLRGGCQARARRGPAGRREGVPRRGGDSPCTAVAVALTLEAPPRAKFEFAVAPPTVQISLPKLRPAPCQIPRPQELHCQSRPRPLPGDSLLVRHAHTGDTPTTQAYPILGLMLCLQYLSDPFTHGQGKP